MVSVVNCTHFLLAMREQFTSTLRKSYLPPPLSSCIGANIQSTRRGAVLKQVTCNFMLQTEMSKERQNFITAAFNDTGLKRRSDSPSVEPHMILLRCQWSWTFRHSRPAWSVRIPYLWMEHVKNLTSTITQMRFNSLAHLSIGSQLSRQLDFKDISDFANKKVRHWDFGSA